MRSWDVNRGNECTRKQTFCDIKPGGGSAHCDQSGHRTPDPLAFQRFVSGNLVRLPLGKSHCCSLRWEGPASPSSLLKETFEILPCRDDLGLTIDPPESSQAKALHPMPLFALCKQWFHPHF